MPEPLQLHDPERERREDERWAQLLAEGACRTEGAVEFTGLPRTRLYELRREGRIETLQDGKTTLWPRVGLRRLLLSLKRRPPTPRGRGARGRFTEKRPI